MQIKPRPVFLQSPTPQPHARPATVLRDELDAGRFEGGADGLDGAGVGYPFSSFKIGQSGR